MKKYIIIIIYSNIFKFFYIFLTREFPLLWKNSFFLIKTIKMVIYLKINVKHETVNNNDKLIYYKTTLPCAWTHAVNNRAKRLIARYRHMVISGFCPDRSPSLYILPPTSTAHSFLKHWLLRWTQVEEQWKQKNALNV